MSAREPKRFSLFAERTWNEYLDFQIVIEKHLREFAGAELDRVHIQQLTGIIDDVLHKLRELGKIPKDEFLRDYRNTESAKYLFVKVTEAAIDICNHIATTHGGRAPKDYADCFSVLEELRAIPGDLAKRLKRMARFRNLIVHLYWQVDDAKVYEIIKKDLGDVEEYLRQIASYVQKDR